MSEERATNQESASFVDFSNQMEANEEIDVEEALPAHNDSLISNDDNECLFKCLQQMMSKKSLVHRSHHRTKVIRKIFTKREIEKTLRLF